MKKNTIARIEIRVGGQIAWHIDNYASGESQTTLTLPMRQGSIDYPLVVEGVRRTMDQYGEVIRKLSNE
jgi:hypothetical protein